MAPGSLPSREYLRQCFNYDPESGVLWWKERPPEHFPSTKAWRAWNTKCAGNICKHPRTRGYLGCRLDGGNRLNHRIIYKLMTGETPTTVDHINHITNDNRWVNLRHATIAENTRHMRGHKDRKYPNAMKGAYRHKAGWLAFIGLNGKQIYLGVFKTEQAAHERYIEEAKRLHGDFAGPIVAT